MDRFLVSVTNRKHQVLERLSSAPFDDLYATDYKGEISYYSFDTFRRLYNDAVESMLCYERLTESYRQEAEQYRKSCDELENRLRGLSED